jgi:hypothetical protein
MAAMILDRRKDNEEGNAIICSLVNIGCILPF